MAVVVAEEAAASQMGTSLGSGWELGRAGAVDICLYVYTWAFGPYVIPVMGDMFTTMPYLPDQLYPSVLDRTQRPELVSLLVSLLLYSRHGKW